MLLQLPAKVPADEPLLRVTDDGAYDTQTAHAAVVERNTTPIILPRKSDSVMSRTFERQVSELHVRVAILNWFTELAVRRL